MLLYSTPTSTTVNTSIVSVDTAKDTSSCAKNNDFFVDTVKNTSSFLYTEKNDATIDNINDTSSLVFTENNYPSIDTLNDVNFIKTDETITSISLSVPGDLTFNFTKNDSIFEVKSVDGSFFFDINAFQDDTIVKCDDLARVTIMYVNLSDINDLFGLHKNSSLWNLENNQDIFTFIEEKNIYGMYGNIQLTNNLNLSVGKVIHWLFKPSNDLLKDDLFLPVFVLDTGKIVCPLSVEVGVNNNYYF